ncbi:MAG: class I SAM-dependent methyltransferase [Candidatus Promineifilaceae bacterium]
MNKATIQQTVQAQFGRSAADYVTSSVHAKGWTLQRMVDLVQPQADWKMLDIATAGAHTAIIFAPHVAHVVASDITQEMLEVAAGHSAEKGITNISFEYAEAGNLPFNDNSFDLVTCRIAPHHFPDIFTFLRECHRVVKAGGTVAIVDNIVPDGLGGDYINAFEKLRDPSHVSCNSAEMWEQDIYGAGLTLTHKETGNMAIPFDSWVTRMRVSDDNRLRLKALLAQAPDEAASSLTPKFDGDTITFYLQRIVLIAKKEV